MNDSRRDTSPLDMSVTLPCLSAGASMPGVVQASCHLPGDACSAVKNGDAVADGTHNGVLYQRIMSAAEHGGVESSPVRGDEFIKIFAEYRT